MPMAQAVQLKSLVWIGSSRKDLRSFPEDVRDLFGYALYVAQTGGKHPDAKPLKGFGGAGVLEIVDDHAGSTYRAVCMVRLTDAVYGLHAFQKKSTAGIATRKQDVDLVKQRLKQAEALHRQEYGK
jgi:phage-related protein